MTSPQDPTHNSPRAALRTDELDELCAQIEAGWRMRDPLVAERLSLAYPSYADQLYAFLSLLIHSAPGSRAPSPEETSTAVRLRQWLEREGYGIAHAASSAARHAAVSPTSPSSTTAAVPEAAAEGTGLPPDASLIGLLRRTTKLQLVLLARDLDIPTGFLLLVSRFPTLLPPTVRREVVRRAARSLPGREQDIELLLTRDPLQATAASRDTPYADRPRSFDDLVHRSDMDASHQAYWRQLATRTDSADA
jgi:hypothetical protein